MTLQEQEKAIRKLQGQLKRGTPIEPTAENIVLLKQVGDTLDEMDRLLASLSFLQKRQAEQ